MPLHLGHLWVKTYFPKLTQPLSVAEFERHVEMNGDIELRVIELTSLSLRSEYKVYLA